MSRPASVHRQPLSSRLLAATLALVVFGLSLLAVAPTAHVHLHDDAGHTEHTCAIVLFAHGVTAATTFLLIVAPLLRLTDPLWVARADWVGATARLLPPACGPPAV